MTVAASLSVQRDFSRVSFRDPIPEYGYFRTDGQRRPRQAFAVPIHDVAEH